MHCLPCKPMTTDQFDHISWVFLGGGRFYQLPEASNTGRLGGKFECYLSAVPSPIYNSLLLFFFFTVMESLFWLVFSIGRPNKKRKWSQWDRHLSWAKPIDLPLFAQCPQFTFHWPIVGLTHRGRFIIADLAKWIHNWEKTTPQAVKLNRSSFHPNLTWELLKFFDLHIYLLVAQLSKRENVGDHLELLEQLVFESLYGAQWLMKAGYMLGAKRMCNVLIVEVITKI